MNDLLNDIQQLISEYSGNWAANLLAIAFGSLLGWLLWRFIYSRLVEVADKTKLKWDDVLIHSIKAPVSALIWCWPMIIGLSVLLENVFDRSITSLQTVQILLVIVLVIWTLFRLVSNITDLVLKHHNRDETTVHAISKIVRIIIFIIGVLTAMQTLGLSLSGLLTFGGVGGLIVGMAAKDLLSNFFGGMMVYLDRPFQVGDWIRSPDRNIEGTVEKIGWRMTIIRTFDKRPIYVPNAIFSNIVVENPSRMHNRRINETIGLRYQDAEKVNAIIADVTNMIKNHEAIDTRQTIIVNFTQFGPSSLDFFIYAFTQTVDWVRYHEIKQDILLQTIKIIHNHGAGVAHPTRTLLIEPHTADQSSQKVSTDLANEL